MVSSQSDRCEDDEQVGRGAGVAHRMEVSRPAAVPGRSLSRTCTYHGPDESQNCEVTSGYKSPGGSYHADGVCVSEVMDNFCGSVVASTVVTYVLGFGDRHLENIMLTRRVQLFHVDFSFAGAGVEGASEGDCGCPRCPRSCERCSRRISPLVTEARRICVLVSWKSLIVRRTTCWVTKVAKTLTRVWSARTWRMLQEPLLMCQRFRFRKRSLSW